MGRRWGRGALGKGGVRAEGGRQSSVSGDPHPLTPTQDEYEELDSVYKEEKAQLEELKQKHDVLMEEFNQIRAEQEINSRKRMEAEQELVRMVRAATVIQAVWKGPGPLPAQVQEEEAEQEQSQGQEGEGQEEGQGQGQGEGQGEGQGQGQEMSARPAPRRGHSPHPSPPREPPRKPPEWGAL